MLLFSMLNQKDQVTTTTSSRGRSPWRSPGMMYKYQTQYQEIATP